jgi:FkbM family methyltransferase
MTTLRINPLLLRRLPIRLRQAVWARCYHPTKVEDKHLFEGSRLHFAPQIEMRLIPNDWISDSIAFTGVYESQLSRWVARAARRTGGLMIDVGANLGYFSLLWAAQNPANRVLAFEASPRNVALLRENVQRNRLQDRIEIRADAVGKVPGTCQFDVGPADQTGWGGLTIVPTSDSIRVNVVRLDDLFPPPQTIDLLKVDVEGADSWVLQGAAQLFRSRRVRCVWWEQHKPRMRLLGIQEREPELFMTDVGYTPIAHEHRESECVQWHAVAPKGSFS